MKRNRLTKPTQMIAGLMSGLLAILVVPLIAQPADDSRLYYDVTREVTLSGMVSGVLTRSTPGMTWGSHLLIGTVSGTVDASLGRWGLQGKGGLSVNLGQYVEVTGVMKTFNGKQVLLVRTVKLGGKVFKIRNEYGIPVSPQAREHAAQKGESL
jgi:hypothetical protein